MNVPSSQARLAAMRQEMKAAGVDAALVGSADPWLNEYVPVDESRRAFITGFVGSAGDAIITADRAILVVDGRYTLQAKQEAVGFDVVVISLDTSIEKQCLEEILALKENGVRSLALEVDSLPVGRFNALSAFCQENGITPLSMDPSLVVNVRKTLDAQPAPASGRTWAVDESFTGRTVKKRLAEAAPALREQGLDGLLVVPLDEIAFITNLRGSHLPYQATFHARCVVLHDRVLLAAEGKKLRKGTQVEPEISLLPPNGLVDEVKRRAPLRLGYAPGTTTEAMRAALVEAGAELVPAASPFAAMRHLKTPQELSHMSASMRAADLTFKRLQSWLHGAVSHGERVTEKDVADKMFKLFKRSGAWGLSFGTIAGAGPHGAIIHYGEHDDKTALQPGDLFLLDAGAFYDGGYATDMTRTFVVSRDKTKVNPEHQRMFTLVLKSAIAGMSARFPKGTSGEAVDALVRAPMWRAGEQYGHGTGHGVGVNVHESPPRVAPGSRGSLQVGQVFSIEPGFYVEGVGGVRIENLCTVVEDPDNSGFLRVRPMTFSPLDPLLIDKKMLSPQEKAFLVWFKERHKADDGLNGPLPPLQ